jgi:chromosome segregation ATPase
MLTSHKTLVYEKLNAITENLEKLTEESKLKALETADAHLEEFERAQEARYKNLAALADDAETIETELRKHIESFGARTQKEYTQMEEESERRRMETITAWTSSLAETKERIDALANELDALKTEAARNISEKVTLFENEFTAGLEKRKEKIDSLFDNWLRETENQLESLHKETESRYRESTAGAAENCRKNISDIENRVNAELNRLKEDTSSFEKSIRDEMRIADSSLDTLKEHFKTGLEEARGNAEFELKNDITRQTMENNDKLKAFKADMESNIKTLSAQMEGKTQELSRLMEEARQDAEKIDSVVKQKISGIHFEYEQKIDTLNSAIEEKLQAFNNDIQTRMNTVNDSYNEQIDTLNKTLDSIAEKNSDMAGKAGREITRLFANITEMKDNIKKERDDILAQTEIYAKELKENIKTAAEQIDDFYAKTKLIDKSFELKEELAKNMDELKSELELLEQRRAEVERLDAQFTKIKRLEDDINAKMQQFLTEKQRIEFMENKFERLLTVSHSVEEKLAHVTDNDDMLQEMSIKLKQITDSIENVEEKYNRLEKKKLTLDATAERIDSNYKGLQEAEEKTQQFRAELSLFNSELETIKTALENLGEENKKALEAGERVSVLDSELVHIEERITQMQKAREWLADLEGRIDEKLNDIQRHTKTLSPGGGKQIAGTAITPQIREEVIQLNKNQNWDPAEISKNLKIPLSSVELILEYEKHERNKF